jgi:acetyltransferase-like isoleucine patch superfamily enzyme
LIEQIWKYCGQEVTITKEDRVKDGPMGHFNAVKRRAFKFIAKLSPGYGLRIWLLRMCNFSIGEQVYIGEDFIVIDDVMDDAHYLTIEDRVAISPRVTFVIHTKPNWSKIGDFVNSRKGKIIVRRDAWIGTGAVILPDVEIGEGAVVGANSVVTKNVPPYTIVGGVPAREIGKVSMPGHD